MILAKEVLAYTHEGRTYRLKAFLEIQNIKRASDHGYWFDVKIDSACSSKSWQRVWASDVQFLRD